MKRLARGELEGQVMAVLWDADAWLTPADVQDAITTPRRQLAYTTVMTILVRLHEKGMVQRQQSGRAFAYRPTESRDEYAAERMREMLDASGDRMQTLARFVDAMSTSEAAELRRAMGRRTKR